MTVTLENIFVAAVTLLDAVAIYRALWRTQGAERTLMWIFAILAFPLLGALAYFLLANPSVRRTSRRKKLARSLMGDALGRHERHTHDMGENSMMDLADGVTGLVPTTGNKVEIIPEPPDNFPVLEELISRARHSVWVEFYIIQSDETGLHFLRLLAAAARRGVEVRLLYDAVGSLGIGGKILHEIEEAGVRAEAFHPLGPWRRAWSVHLRNHRKLMIVDGKVALTGSMNVGNEYSWRFLKRGMGRFRDIHLRIEGSAVMDFCQVFMEDWFFAVGENLSPLFDDIPEQPAPSTVAVLPSGPDQEHNAIALLYFGGIATASRRVFVTTPYFIPDESIIRALQFASLRGVDVRLLIPAKVDAMLLGPAGSYYFPQLLKAGVRIYLYLPTMLHTKSMVIDDELSLVGSANLDIRSMRLNFELGVLVSDLALNERLAARFLCEQESSVEVTMESLEKRGVYIKTVEKLARLLSPIL